MSDKEEKRIAKAYIPPEAIIACEHILNPSVREIVKAYLKEHGFDGLFCPHVSCGCPLNDLMPCGEDCSDCLAGYSVTPPDGESSWIAPRKEEDNG